MDVKISIIVENYVRHYLYLAPDLYEELFGGAPDYNQLLMKYQDTSSNYETALGEKNHDVRRCSGNLVHIRPD